MDEFVSFVISSISNQIVIRHHRSTRSCIRLAPYIPDTIRHIRARYLVSTTMTPVSIVVLHAPYRLLFLVLILFR